MGQFRRPRRERLRSIRPRERRTRMVEPGTPAIARAGPGGRFPRARRSNPVQISVSYDEAILAGRDRSWHYLGMDP